MSITLKLNDVVGALDAAMEGHAYYLDKRTGEIILLTEEDMEAADEDMEAAEGDDLISKYPDWQRESILKAREVLKHENVFVPVPDRLEIHDYKIMEDFCLGQGDRELAQRLHRLIKGAGAFRRFNHAIRELDLEDAWYEFRRDELERIAIEWLEQNDIPYTREDEIGISHRGMM